MEKQISWEPDYYVTDVGEIISYKGKLPRVLIRDYSSSYPRVNIGGQKKYVADLVAECFLPPPEDHNCKIFFIDGNKENCSVENLAWLTPSQIQIYTQYTLEYRRYLLKGRT